MKFLLTLICLHINVFCYANEIKIPLIVVAHASQKVKNDFTQFQNIIDIANELLSHNNIKLYLVNDEVLFYSYSKIAIDLNIDNEDLNFEDECFIGTEYKHQKAFERLIIQVKIC